jgi:transcriptional regulator with XRE-family HTH domain
MIHIEYLQEYIHQRKRERVRFNDIAGRINRFLSLRLLLSLMFVSLGLMSCSSDDVDEDAKRREFAQIVENRSAKDLLNDLYVGSDGDIQSLARMLNVTPSSIERIRKGETEPTDKFDKRIKDVSVYYFQNEQSYSKLRSVSDEEWSWYDTILYLPNHYPWWFWGVTIGLFLLTCTGVEGLQIIGGSGMIIELLFFIVVWVISLFSSPNSIEDKYIDTINPTVERVL